jgi:hypothetical protein
VSRIPLVIRALLRISSEMLYCQPSEGPHKPPPGFEENVYELFGSSLSIKKWEANRAKESAASVMGHIFENNGAVEDKLFFLLEI